MVFYFKNCSDLTVRKPFFFSDPEKLLQIPHHWPIGTNNTINTSCQEKKGCITSVTTLSQYVSASMRARKLNRMATKKATKTV